MQALTLRPGEAGSTAVVAMPDPRPDAGQVLVRPVEVGVCGTDREISEGWFGVAPPGEERLILGHELLGRVEHGGHGFACGDLVTATVRRSCGHCAACAEGAPDACETGEYSEHGITRLHGFAAELAVVPAEHLVAVPEALGRLGVLAEPASICARALRHVRAVGGRQPWHPGRALVFGAGAIGMLCTYFLRLEGLEVWTCALQPPGSEQARLVEAAGARYVTALPEDPADFDVVVQAAGSAQLSLDTLGLLRRNGVACLLGIDGHDQVVRLPGPVIGIDAILGNRALIASVNANVVDWHDAVERLAAAQARWPDALERFVGLRTSLDDFAAAFAFGGVKAALTLTP
ncbi:MAG TPA: alcohol dehydrogenase catalytic domain-containing protein [Thermoleophilaceae bacterium]|nr:alcohol dehydrogenase catalytic domain-containing protein [Thermoleophilaceae bacterium]